MRRKKLYKGLSNRQFNKLIEQAYMEATLPQQEILVPSSIKRTYDKYWNRLSWDEKLVVRLSKLDWIFWFFLCAFMFIVIYLGWILIDLSKL